MLSPSDPLLDEKPATSTRTIWKFPLDIKDDQEVKVPYGGIVRHVGLQQIPDRPVNQLCMWVEVDPDAKIQTHGVYVVGTGNPVPENVDFVGSVVADPFVWHVYTTIGSEW